ncbi:hypothetical protein QO010_002946 [Caulobacter ginsengisoli]|uniref:Carboxymuconolactone decarboxylase-like domain-containing protein n=1 Tax=Caulobacter ginsengisoli TaxID=400775 RepID=A0ABU0IT26_9CAUL|nr:hypothetical protein [Caulobacter ginsengisoli]MDQ0465162.1 hypothetical protein [Caulobacter ginsengisoli]
MLRAILKAAIGRFEKRYDYDVSYMRQLIDADPAAFQAFSAVQKLSSYRKGAPPAAIAAAGLIGTMAEDCGPCTQIGVKIAEEAGLPSRILKGILTGDEAAMGPDASLARRFALASLARDLEAADPLRDEVVRRWGEKGLAALALSMAAARVYPTVKYALGHGKACSKVRVADEDLVVTGGQLAA